MKVRKILLTVCLLSFVFVANAKAVQRVVLSEDFTGTWCPYCPYAAVALHRLSDEVKDSLIYVAYHFNSSSQTDPFRIPKNIVRANYYGVTGLPTVMFDGVIKEVGGSSGTYNDYRNAFNTRKVISSQLKIELTGSYTTSTNNGNVNAKITNTGANTISGTIQFILTETDIAYVWLTEDSIFYTVRDILPDGNGEAVTIPGGGSINKSRNFTVNTSWNENKCDMIVFVQGSSKEIYQAAKVRITNLAVEENPKAEDRKPKLEISPNPFSQRAVIRVQGLGGGSEVKVAADFSLRIYDLAGRSIRTIPIHNSQSPVTEVTWDGRDELGSQVASGIYLCVLKSGSYRVVNKIALAR